MLTLTSFGLRVLVVDADIVFLGDPTKARQIRERNVEQSSDLPFGESFLFKLFAYRAFGA